MTITEKVSFQYWARFTIFRVDKSSLKNAKYGPIWLVFGKPDAGGQTVLLNTKFPNKLPDRSVLRRQKLVENAKIEKFKYDIFGDFQTT